MPIRVRTSSQLGLVAVIFEGVVTADEVQRELTPLLDDPRYALLPLALFDVTGATRFEGSTDVLRDGARRAAVAIDTLVQPGARTAIAASRDEFFGFGRMYEMLRDGSPGEFHVFRSLEEAEKWLGLASDWASTVTDAT